ncbi:hypothetical protein [Actinoplanes sp. URMC 104]|uniref:hypothetical protein n=1 Tax=Actinoplanes sp. URMC 104 TaxID=3423409 RepID=UPI003F1D0D98
MPGEPTTYADFDEASVLSALSGRMDAAVAVAVWRAAAKKVGAGSPVTTWDEARLIAAHIEEVAQAVKAEVARPLRVRAIINRAIGSVPERRKPSRAG